MAAQEVDTRLPAAGVASFGEVLTAGASGVEHFPSGKVAAVEGVLVM
jgi:hypothetical protein